MRNLVIIASKSNVSLKRGFLKAAVRLGLRVTILTDRPDDHGISDDSVRASLRIVRCDVTSPFAIIDCITRLGTSPAAIFSNSDHLQAATALAANYFDLPAKDWRATWRCKNKAAMRAALTGSAEAVGWLTASHPDELAMLAPPSFPCIVKPREGVASEHVTWAHDREELEDACQRLWSKRPGTTALIEPYLEGDLCTLETIGDGKDLLILGGYRCALTPPPDFVVTQMRWEPEYETSITQSLRRQLTTLGVNFGACHTEFIIDRNGTVRLVEVNYRTIGDGADMLMNDVLDVDYFEVVLRLYLGGDLPEMTRTHRAAGLRYLFAGEIARVPRPPARFEPLTPEPGAGNALSNRSYAGRITATASDPAELERILSSPAQPAQEAFA